jgi:hypothetical protein
LAGQDGLQGTIPAPQAFPSRQVSLCLIPVQASECTDRCLPGQEFRAAGRLIFSLWTRCQNLCTDFPFHTFFVLEAQLSDLPAQIFMFRTLVLVWRVSEKMGALPEFWELGVPVRTENFGLDYAHNFVMCASPVLLFSNEIQIVI